MSQNSLPQCAKCSFFDKCTIPWESIHNGACILFDPVDDPADAEEPAPERADQSTTRSISSNPSNETPSPLPTVQPTPAGVETPSAPVAVKEGPKTYHIPAGAFDSDIGTLDLDRHHEARKDIAKALQYLRNIAECWQRSEEGQKWIQVINLEVLYGGRAQAHLGFETWVRMVKTLCAEQRVGIRRHSGKDLGLPIEEATFHCSFIDPGTNVEFFALATGSQLYDEGVSDFQ